MSFSFSGSIDVFGVCADIVDYQRAQPQPLFELYEDTDIATVTRLASVIALLCPEDLLPAMCSLFFPPLNITGLQLCPEGCNRLTIECLVVVPSFTEVQCDILPSGQDVGNGLCQVLQTSTEIPETPSVTSRQPETSIVSTDGPETTPASTTGLPVIQSSPATSSESSQPPSTSTLAISTSTPDMVTPEELINVGGMCAEFLPYSESLSRPAFMASRTLSSELTTLLVISNNVCAVNLIVGMCSLFYPPSALTGLSLCQETCQRMFLNIGGCPIISSFLDVDVEDCAMFPEETDQGNGLCLQASPSTAATTTTVSTEETQTPSELTSTALPSTAATTTTVSTEETQTPGEPTSTETTTPEVSIDVFGVCSEELSYQRAQPQPLFQIDSDVSIERITQLASVEVFCPAELLFGICSIFFPPLASTGLQICPETCVEVITGCPVVAAVFSAGECDILPQGQDTGNGLCQGNITETTVSPQPTRTSTGTMSVQQTTVPPSTSPEILTLVTGKTLEQTTRATTTTSETPDTACVPVAVRCQEVLPYSVAQRTVSMETAERALDIFRSVLPCDENFLALLCSDIFKPCPGSGFGTGYCSDQCSRIRNECFDVFNRLTNLAFPVDCSSLPNNIFNSTLAANYGLCN
ncbi:hypothetical protein HOLleu_40319 [Holothuria leucospilota]|uniref:FZ domain-containing protein n=1 Tax=Holothuria leucospilota TaxID=206669 RepID=A0A9Q0YI40_HOLLE|nr:hypothetical protein HOLleu_40319 [Holothuria leucospilota]